MKNPVRSVAIFGYFGAGNLGDEAVVDVLIRQLRSRYPGVAITGICLDPEDVRQHHGIDAVPLRRLPRSGHASSENVPLFTKVARRLSVIMPSELLFLVRSYRRLKGTDLVIVGGSGQLVDNEGGPLNHPYNHLKWTILARMVGAKFFFLSVGAGPLLTRFGKWLIKRSLLLSQYRSFRDEYSRQLVESFGVAGPNIVCPDQAFSIVRDEGRAPGSAGRRPVVGVAPIAYLDPRHWPEVDPVRYRTYVSEMAEVTRWLVDNGYDVLFFHTQVNGDDNVIPDILDRLGPSLSAEQRGHISEHPVRWFTDAFDAIAKTDYVIASRFHAVIFSYVMNRTVVAVSYDRKINNAMAAVGQSGFALDIRSFRANEVTDRFTALTAQPEGVRTGIRASVGEFRKQIEQQYDTIFR